jgi:hypothetical protein
MSGPFSLGSGMGIVISVSPLSAEYTVPDEEFVFLLSIDLSGAPDRKILRTENTLLRRSTYTGT